MFLCSSFWNENKKSLLEYARSDSQIDKKHQKDKIVSEKRILYYDKISERTAIRDAVFLYEQVYTD